MADINLKLEAERLSGSGNKLLDVAKQLVRIAADNPGALELAGKLVGVAQDMSDSATRLVTGAEMNLKLEAERLSTTSSSLLDVARRLAHIAGENPSVASQAQNILGIAQDTSNTAATLVGR
jgi:hypothetical protein